MIRATPRYSHTVTLGDTGAAVSGYKHTPPAALKHPARKPPRPPLSPEVREAVLALVRAGVEYKDICAKYLVTKQDVSKMAIRAGLRRVSISKPLDLGDVPQARPPLRGFGQQPLRHDAFDVLTPDAAYWCGVPLHGRHDQRTGDRAARSSAGAPEARLRAACQVPRLPRLGACDHADSPAHRCSRGLQPVRQQGNRGIPVLPALAADRRPPVRPRPVRAGCRSRTRRFPRLLAGLHRRRRHDQHQLRRPVHQAVRFAMAASGVRRLPRADQQPPPAPCARRAPSSWSAPAMRPP